MDLFKHVSKIIIKEARDVDRELFYFFFMDGSKEDVITHLKAYQHPSGGFSNGLEPDYLNPYPSAIQTWTAIHYFKDIKLDIDDDLVVNTVKYLESEMEEKDFFETVHQKNNDYPHAIWWHYKEGQSIWGFNPSISLWAFLYEVKKGQKAKTLIEKAFDAFILEPKIEMHELKAFIDAYEWLYDLKNDFPNFLDFEEKLIHQVLNILRTYQPEDLSYGPSPIGFFDDVQKQLYRHIKPYIDIQVNHLKKVIPEDDLWDVPFSWGQYESHFQKAKTEWKCIQAIKYLRFILKK